jgi:hypothetical protein
MTRAMAGGSKGSGWLSMTGQVLNLDFDMGYSGSLNHPKKHAGLVQQD